LTAPCSTARRFSILGITARLLTGTAMVVVALAGPAAADGGAGGTSSSGAGGAGGADNATGVGGNGTNGGLPYGGGGGGGAGAVTGGAGGTGGTNAGFPRGGNGGTGGVHGTVGASLPGATATGTTGGNGGNFNVTGAGGGGGGGGYGAVVTGTGGLGTLSFAVTGGDGGTGGGGDTAWFDQGGSGGSGGIGLFFSDGSATTTFTVDAAVSGGDGGAAGAGGVAAGSGGVGIVGANLAISLTGAGSIAGGLGGGTRALAIRFTGGANTLTFGNATPGITGGIAIETGSLALDSVGGTTLANVISGGGSVIKQAAATIVLTGINTYTGGTTVSGGTLRAGVAGALVGNTAYTVDNGTLDLNNFSLTMSSLSGAGGQVALGSGNLTVNQAANTIYAGAITGTGALIKSGAGALTLSGTNTYAGGTTVSGGILRAGVAGALVGNTAYTVNNGTLDLNNFSLTMSSLSGTGGQVALGSGNLTVDQATNTGYAGAITGTGALIKSGAGALTLSGTNTYAGGTTINAGSIIVAVDANLGDAAGSLIFAAATGPNTGATTGVGASMRTTASFSSARNITLNSFGGRIETDAGTTLTVSGLITSGGGASLVKQGDGTLVLTGNSGAGHIGRTFVNAGTLRIEAGGTLGGISSGTAYVNNGAIAVVTGAGSLWQSGVQMRVGDQGSGTLNIEAGGRVVSAGNNAGLVGVGGDSSVTITGTGSEWFADGSRVYVGHVYAASLTLANGGRLQIGAGSNGTLQAGIDPAGAGGTIIVGAAEGSPAAAAGTLSLGFVELVSSSSKMVFNHTDGAYSFVPLASGDGSVRQVAGTTVLNAANTYTGGTFVEGGTLRAGIAGALVGNTVYTVNGGTLDLNNFALTMSSLSGTGGQVALGSGNLTVNQAGNTSFAGGISGTGNLVKQGAGTLALSGASTYLGSTSVTAGKLVVNGSIASSSGLTIAAGAEVGGTGVLPATVVNGILAPGNSIGTVTVSGALTFAPGSTYAVEVSPTDADRTNVVAGLGGPGNAVLSGATVATTYAVGAYIQRQYTIVNAAGGLGGTTFAGLTGAAPAGFTHRLTYDGNNAYLALALLVDPTTPTPPGPGNPVPFGSLNRNQQAVANTVIGFFNANGYLPAALAPAAPFDLSLMSGEISTTAISAGFDAADRFVQVLGDPELGGQSGAEGAEPLGYTSGKNARLGATLAGSSAAGRAALAALGGEPKTDAAGEALLSMTGAHSADAVDTVFTSRWRGWGAAYGGARAIGGDAATGSQDADIRNWGVAAGMDHRLGDGRVGFGLGGAGSSFSLANGLGSGNAGVFNAGLYGSQDFGNAYVSGVLAYGWHSVRTSRSVGGDTLSSRYNAHSLSGRVEAGYRFDMAATGITPYAAAQATGFYLPAYAETAASGANTFALAYGRQSRTAARTELGFRLDHTVPLENGRLVFSGRAAWAWNGGNAPVTTAAFQALPGGQPFAIQGATPARHSLLVDAGAELALTNGVSAKLGFQGEFSRNVKAYGATAKLSVKW